MSEKSYWRGYVDAQSKTEGDLVIATSKREKQLEPLAELVKAKVEPYRSGFLVQIKNVDKYLPQKFDADYASGFFDARGQRYKNPIRLTVTSVHLPQFISLLQKLMKIDLPKPQKPSKTSASMRVIITGDKAEKVDNFLRAV